MQLVPSFTTPPGAGLVGMHSLFHVLIVPQESCIPCLRDWVRIRISRDFFKWCLYSVVFIKRMYLFQQLQVAGRQLRRQSCRTLQA